MRVAIVGTDAKCVSMSLSFGQRDIALMFGSLSKKERSVTLTKPVDVIDLFCGAGGFSQGAVQAGHRVIFACDSDSNALETHKRNHPHGCAHRCAMLPINDIPYPTDGRPYHLHGSPPCQKFSNAQRHGPVSREVMTQNESLVRWFLQEAVVRSGCTSWSMEEVDSPRLRKILDQYKWNHRAKLDWDVFDFELLGVPQSRTRILAGTPELIVRMRQLRSARLRRGVRSVIDKPRGTHVKGTRSSVTVRQRARREPGEAKNVYKKAPLNESCRPIAEPAHTVCASKSPSWVTFERGKPAHSRIYFDSDDLAAVQTFPPEYKWPAAAVQWRRQIGNAVPPLVAQLLMGGRPIAPRAASSAASSPSTAPAESRCSSPSVRRKPPVPRWAWP